ncbi:transcriptional regulator [Chitinimonas koreensis]|uniref:transcriptional regulator n=1 Tax=Chitinimonas koreensis TaxID=356302 RepID=UPI000421E170|nr:transcriptional regulator [Chitinimonas koreensis]QNM95449.1 transcriptional regulator [Chitinimonas koreensis]
MEETSDRSVKRMAFLQDGLNAWNDYCVTGRHITEADANAWLLQLEQGIDAEPPTPRRPGPAEGP